MALRGMDCRATGRAKTAQAPKWRVARRGWACIESRVAHSNLPVPQPGETRQAFGLDAACVTAVPPPVGTGPNPAQLAQMAALVLALARTAKANAAAQAQRNQQTILAVGPRIQQLAALAKA
jgi:hypothetical protein